jgi:hypothetical protein
MDLHLQAQRMKCLRHCDKLVAPLLHPAIRFGFHLPDIRYGQFCVFLFWSICRDVCLGVLGIPMDMPPLVQPIAFRRQVTDQNQTLRKQFDLLEKCCRIVFRKVLG